MNQVITLKSDSISVYTLEDKLTPYIQNTETQLKIETTRGVSSEFLIAIVGASGTAIGALITGFFNLSARKIILEGKSGWKIEVPAQMEIQKIEELIKKVKELEDLEKVEIN